MRTITLHGALGERFGGPFDMEVASAAEAARALGTQLPGFLDEVRAGEFLLVRGDLPGGMALAEDELLFGLGKADLHIIPVTSGSKRQGTGKIILGIAMIAFSFTPMLGTELTIHGVRANNDGSQPNWVTRGDNRDGVPAHC